MHSAPKKEKPHQKNENNKHNPSPSSACLDVKSGSTVLDHSWRILRLAFRQRIPRAKATSHPLTAIFLAFYLPDLAAVKPERHRDAARLGTVKMSWHSGTPFDGSIDPNQPLVGGSVQSPHHGLSAISPTLQQYPSSSRQGSAAEDLPGRKRKRSYNGEDGPENNVDDSLMQDSPSSASKGKHQPGVKRACNDCRQQKVGENSRDESHASWSLTCFLVTMQRSSRWSWRV